MNWSDYLIAGFLAFAFLMTVGSIGKVRKPVTPSVAVVAFFMDAILIGCLLLGHGVFS